jgi:hypothetical protein
MVQASHDELSELEVNATEARAQEPFSVRPPDYILSIFRLPHVLPGLWGTLVAANGYQ